MSEEIYQPKFQTGYTVVNDSSSYSPSDEIVICTYKTLASIVNDISIYGSYDDYDERDTYHTYYAIYIFDKEACYWSRECNIKLVCSNPNRGKKILNIPKVQRDIVISRSIPPNRVGEFLKILQ